MCICGIHRNKLMYTENADKILHVRTINESILNSNISANLKPKSKIFEVLVRSSKGFIWQNQLKPKNVMQVYPQSMWIQFNADPSGIT